MFFGYTPVCLHNVTYWVEDDSIFSVSINFSQIFRNIEQSHFFLDNVRTIMDFKGGHVLEE